MSYTTIEQSKRLIGIGLDPDTADATNHDIVEERPSETESAIRRVHAAEQGEGGRKWRQSRKARLRRSLTD